jgi:hypothetical protein
MHTLVEIDRSMLDIAGSLPVFTHSKLAGHRFFSYFMYLMYFKFRLEQPWQCLQQSATNNPQGNAC